MAYNYSSAVNDIIKYKKWWNEADAAGDDAAKKNAQNMAAKAYSWLNNNGYRSDANTLGNSDYTAAKKWATNNKTATRDYLYSLGKGYGMSKSDVDKIVSYDDLTGNISIGGKNIGSADVTVDGVSYWNDTSKLDNAFSDYAKRTNNYLSNSVMSSQNTSEVNDKINQLWGLQTGDHSELTNMYKQEYNDLKNTNPFTTDEAKAILAKYDLAGLQGRDNAVASGGASNGGNIDSYAAANAMRQQAALVNQGQMAVLEAHQQKLDNARAILEGLGVYQQNNYSGMQNTIGLQQNEAQRLFENDETAKNNQVSRDVATNEATGYNTDNQLKATSSMWKDGVLVDTNIDYQARINEVKKLYDSATNTADKQAYGLTLKMLEMARNDKIAKTGSSETPTYYYQTLVPNASTTLTREQIASAERIAKGENDTNVAMNNANNQNAIDQINAQTEAEKELMEEQAKYSTKTPEDASTEWQEFYDSFSKDSVKRFLVDVVKNIYDNPANLGGDVLEEQLIQAIKDNTAQYDIDKQDARRILNRFGADTSWLDNASNYWRMDPREGMKLD